MNQNKPETETPCEPSVERVDEIWHGWRQDWLNGFKPSICENFEDFLVYRHLQQLDSSLQQNQILLERNATLQSQLTKVENERDDALMFQIKSAKEHIEVVSIFRATVKRLIDRAQNDFVTINNLQEQLTIEREKVNSLGLTLNKIESLSHPFRHNSSVHEIINKMANEALNPKTK